MRNERCTGKLHGCFTTKTGTSVDRTVGRNAIETIRLSAAHRMFTPRWQTPDGIVRLIVVRYIHRSHAAEDARLEANALRELSRAGYPFPELLLLADEGNELFIVMERLPGEALTQVALQKGPGASASETQNSTNTRSRRPSVGCFR